MDVGILTENCAGHASGCDVNTEGFTVVQLAVDSVIVPTTETQAITVEMARYKALLQWSLNSATGFLSVVTLV